ncbi:unnamed protein product [Prorocentrum cordatum]|uniref:Uncharacterized protein n=1 Tax=Prorocentrum cordatum TaxID=2364126 RepID=A0ABN9TTG4_9DINO|nr:unnamed protein product [Polarella glacialis]
MVPMPRGSAVADDAGIGQQGIEHGVGSDTQANDGDNPALQPREIDGDSPALQSRESEGRQCDVASAIALEDPIDGDGGNGQETRTIAGDTSFLDMLDVMGSLQMGLMRAEMFMRAEGCHDPAHESKPLYDQLLHFKALVGDAVSGLSRLNNTLNLGADLLNEFRVRFRIIQGSGVRHEDGFYV